MIDQLINKADQYYPHADEERSKEIRATSEETKKEPEANQISQVTADNDVIHPQLEPPDNATVLSNEVVREQVAGSPDTDTAASVYGILPAQGDKRISNAVSTDALDEHVSIFRSIGTYDAGSESNADRTESIVRSIA